VESGPLSETEGMGSLPSKKLVVLAAVESVVGTLVLAAAEEIVGETSGEENWAEAVGSVHKRSTADMKSLAARDCGSMV
jgi:hypothetical protein